MFMSKAGKNRFARSEEGTEGSVLVDDARRCPRYPTRLKVGLDGAEEIVECQGDVGSGGFRFECDRMIRPGTGVDLAFLLPGYGIWVRARGEVLGNAKAGDSFGVRGCFTAMAHPDLKWLEDWTARVLRES